MPTSTKSRQTADIFATALGTTLKNSRVSVGACALVMAGFALAMPAAGIIGAVAFGASCGALGYTAFHGLPRLVSGMIKNKDTATLSTDERRQTSGTVLGYCVVTAAGSFGLLVNPFADNLSAARQQQQTGRMLADSMEKAFSVCAVRPDRSHVTVAGLRADGSPFAITVACKNRVGNWT